MRKPVLAICEQQRWRHPRSLISTCVVRYLDSIVPILAKSKISGLYLVSVAEQAGLSYPVGNPKDRFPRDEAQLNLFLKPYMNYKTYAGAL